MAWFRDFDIHPGDHDCEWPEVPEDVASDLRNQEGHITWQCECESIWIGEGAFRVRNQGYEYFISWDRETSSGRSWKRRERKRMERLVAALDGGQINGGSDV